ncbi:DUF4332 domain-containing protein [Candidatus Harpocratesius sp.]
MVKQKLSEFESIGQKYAQILNKTMKIQSVDDFLLYSIDEIQSRTQIDRERIKQWSDLIDLFQIPNLSARECELLYYANINSVEELSRRQSLRIFYKLRELDTETRFIVLSFPTFAQIDEWIYFAKHMNKRIKYGLNIPIVLFPMVNLDVASEFKKFSIYTAQHLIEKKDQISKLHKKVHLKKRDFHKLLEMINFIQIPGMDIYFAKVFFEAGITSIQQLKTTSASEIYEQVKVIQKKNEPILEELTESLIKQFQQYEGGFE